LAELRDPSKEHWFTWREEESAERERAVDFTPRPIRDPIVRIQSLLRERLGSRFDLIRAVSFAKLDQEGGNA
jgi:hypothetical protein